MKLSIIAHNIRSLYNVGSIFRNADGFGVEHVYLTGYTGQPPRDEISKVALGAEETVPWSHISNVEECIEKLRNEGAQILALESGPKYGDISKFISKADHIVVLLGNEPNGLEEEVMALATDRVSIPMYGTKTSLNVAVASGIALYALRHGKDIL
jgi:23S rRNA (guanosine2251-2'-O)-methyltransferase